jgi:hypothetical protein
MELLLERKWPKDTYTIGVLYINGQRFCETLEDKDRGLQQAMNLNYINSVKVYGQTAIPTGTYTLGFTYSPKFAKRPWAKKYNGMVVVVPGVKGFDGIRFHPFNDASESLGCIALGENKVKGKVVNAQMWYEKFVDEYFLPAWKRGEKITLTIKN